MELFAANFNEQIYIYIYIREIFRKQRTAPMQQGKRPRWWTVERSTKINVRPLRVCTSTTAFPQNRFNLRQCKIKCSFVGLPPARPRLQSDNHQLNPDVWKHRARTVKRTIMAATYPRCNLPRFSNESSETERSG